MCRHSCDILMIMKEQMTYNEKSDISISVRNLVEFILRSGNIDNRRKSGPDTGAMLEGARLHRMLQRRMGADYHAEVLLRYRQSREDYDIIIEGRADGIIYQGDIPKEQVTIDEIKSTYQDLERMTEPVPVHLAQAKVYAFIVANEFRLREITVRMTYIHVETQEIRYFHETYTFVEIRNWFMDLMDRYVRWADFEFHWKKTRNETIKSVEFPFSYREGQKDLVSHVYRTIYHGKRLFVEAPTGVGKTISTIFPAIKAMGEGLADRVFYLTAKTITRTVAEGSIALLREKGLRYKSVVITAKEKICPNEETVCNPVACPYANGHYDRINDAIYDLLIHEDAFDREAIEQYAKKHEVCPFEMGLDMSLFSDAIICDYNYVFDPNVYLRRFFAEGEKGNSLFLIDEAHNLVDRAMEMYSASIYKERFMEVKRLVKGLDRHLERALENVNKQLLQLKRECEEFMVLESVTPLVLTISRLMTRMEEFLDRKDTLKESDEVLELYFEVRHFVNMFDNMGENDYAIYCEHLEDGRFMVKLLCINPSASLRRCLDKGRSTVFFSATLLPLHYFMDMLSGSREDYTVYAKSVFDERKRGLFIAKDVSSKYSRRNDAEYYRIASYIYEITRSKVGNYLVFFPSHTFLNCVYEKYRESFLTEDTECILQKAAMSETEREAFLSKFDTGSTIDLDSIISMEIEYESQKTLIGFCVMGGIFSEGIDLKGDCLIGSIIVGTGIPMVCKERELLRSCYSVQGLNGFDYAYRYPGMNKVLQAAGRVIRTAEDVGVVALLDERFLEPSYKKMFPREWSVYEISSEYLITEQISEFWKGFEETE